MPLTQAVPSVSNVAVFTVGTALATLSASVFVSGAEASEASFIVSSITGTTELSAAPADSFLGSQFP